MSNYLLRQPVILYETVEALYQHVNEITFEQKLNNLLLRYGQKLSGAQRTRITQLCQKLGQLVTSVCRDVPQNGLMREYFQKWDTESKWQNMCLAKLMIYSFLDLRTTELQASLDHTLQTAVTLLEKPFVLFDINSGGMSLRPAEPGETPPDLVDQLDQLGIEEQYRWKVYKSLQRYPEVFRELAGLLEPVARRMEAALSAFLPEIRAEYDHWDDFFAAHSFAQLLEQMANQSFPEDELDTYVNLSILAGNEIIYTPGTLEGKDYRQVYLGILLNEDFRVNRLQMTDEAICNLLKVVSDRSKFEILRRISRNSSYCQELAREMNLTTATISRHMSLLLDAGLVHSRQSESRIYYDLNREAISNLCDMVCGVLLEM